MITLRTISLEDFQRKKLLRSGFVEVSPDKFERINGNVRETWQRTEGGWLSSFDMLAGIKVLDDSAGLLP